MRTKGTTSARRVGILFLCLCCAGLAGDSFSAVKHHAKRSNVSTLSGLLHYQTKMLEPTLHHELSVSQIESLSGFNKNGRWQNPGLTVGSHQLKTDFQVGGTQRSDQSGVKVWLETLDVVFQYEGMDVYLANDYAEGSCEATQIYMHEMQHVKVHRKVYAKYSTELKRALLSLSLPTRKKPASYASLNAAQKDLSAKLKAITEGVYARFKKELADENGRLDTVANYKAVQSRCHDWK